MVLLSLIKREHKVREYGYEEDVYYMDDPKFYDERDSLQFLKFTIERTVMLNFGYWHLTNDSQWHTVFKNLYEMYPYPMLYYSLQCNNDSTLTRIGQDFAYSNKLHKEILPDILKRLLAIIINNDAPSAIVKRAYIIAAELFVSVKSELWSDDFMIIWRSLILPMYPDSHRQKVEYKFAYRAFNSISSIITLPIPATNKSAS